MNLGQAEHTPRSTPPADCDGQQAQGAAGRQEPARGSLWRPTAETGKAGWPEEESVSEPPRPGCLWIPASITHLVSQELITRLLQAEVRQLEGGRRQSVEPAEWGTWGGWGYATFDAEYLWNPWRTEGDMFTFPRALMAPYQPSERRKCGCDKFINRAQLREETTSRQTQRSGQPSMNLGV